MTYEVLARKWRPQSFNELVGQDSVKTILLNSLKQNRLHPVLLFTGPRGTGKTSTARIFAKTLRCTKKKNFVPCCECEDCKLIGQGQSLDVIEIDGASHNGVEAIRNLRETIHYMPTTGTHKVYIIDEVHMLTVSAFNALLKTLEEPPAHVFFVMATTESQKIPNTVISRSQRLDFYLISQKVLKDHLSHIAQREGISIQEEALWLITKQAQGSLRDGQGLLDQMMTFCEKEITEQKIISLLGLTERSLLLKTLELVIQGKEPELLKVLQDMHTKGSDSHLFMQDFIELIRNLLMLKISPHDSSLVHASEQEIQKLKELSELISREDIHLLFDMTLKGEKEMTFCHDKRLALEVFLLRLSQAPKLEEIAPLQQKKESSLKNSFLAEKRSSSKKAEPPSLSLKKEKPPLKESFSAEEGGSVKEKGSSLQNPPNPLEKTWFRFINHLKTSHPKQSALVECLSLKEKDGTHFRLYLSNKYSFLKAQIMAGRSQIEKEFNQFLNQSEKFTIEVIETDQDLPLLGDQKRHAENKELFDEIYSDPFVKKVNQVFKGEVKALIPKDNPKD